NTSPPLRGTATLRRRLRKSLNAAPAISLVLRRRSTIYLITAPTGRTDTTFCPRSGEIAPFLATSDSSGPEQWRQGQCDRRTHALSLSRLADRVGSTCPRAVRSEERRVGKECSGGGGWC